MVPARLGSDLLSWPKSKTITLDFGREVSSRALLKISDPDARFMLERRTSLYLFVLVFSVYLLTTSGTTTFVTLDGMVRLEVVKKFTSELRLDVPEKFGAGFALRGADGKFFDPHELGHALFSVPFYIAGQKAGNPKFFLSLLNPLALALAAVTFYRLNLAVGYSLSTSVTLTLVLALCTQLWPESKSPFDHSLETLFCLVAFYKAYQYLQTRTNSSLMASGLFLGLALMTRTTAVLTGFSLGALITAGAWQTGRGTRPARILKEVVPFLLGLLPGLAVTLGYNCLRFGSVLTTGYARWSEFHQVESFSYPMWKGLLGLLISPGKGLLLYCPIVMMSILAYKKFFAWKKGLALVLVLLVFPYLMLLSRYIAWHGDFAWGPRYLTVLLPFLILPLGLSFEEGWCRSVLRRMMIYGLVILSFLIQLMAVAIDMNVFSLRAQTAGILNPDFAWRTYAIPDSFYFRAENSPIIARMYEIRDAFQFGRSNETDSNPDLAEIIKTPQRDPEIDFWWSHLLTDKSSDLLLVVTLLLVGVALAAIQLRFLVKSSVATRRGAG